MTSLKQKQRLPQSSKDLVFLLAMLVFLISVTIILSSQLSLVSLVHVRGQTIDPSVSSQTLFSNNTIISTRGHFNYSHSDDLVSDHDTIDYEYHDTLTDDNQILCPPEKEIAIYVHGAWMDEQAANEQLNRTAISLISNNYTIPLIGFSWDSNTPVNREGWVIAKDIAEKNGPKLAQFVLDFKNKCKDTDIRFIAHSLGAEVVNGPLASLNSNQEWNKSGLNITSVHLLGAAIDRNSVAANATFGKAINKVVSNFYNIRDSEDNMLIRL